MTTDESRYVYLSDGGHFENLGLYEMVLRGCRRIVVVDSGCDPECSCEDLGNAVRKIRIDLKVPIVFSEESVRLLRARRSRYALATIRYSVMDASREDGILVYVKPMLLGNEVPDVASYAIAHRGFLHQTTADQWFSESQTESYRRLGLQTIEDISAKWAGGTLEDWARHLSQVPWGESLCHDVSPFATDSRRSALDNRD